MELEDRIQQQGHAGHDEIPLNIDATNNQAVLYDEGDRETTEQERPRWTGNNRRALPYIGCLATILTLFVLLVIGYAFVVDGAWPWSNDGSTVPFQPQEGLVSGPLVGHTTHSSTKIWLLPGTQQNLQLVFHPKGIPNTTTTLDISPSDAFHGATTVTLDGLDPNTAYRYEIRSRDEDVHASGGFKTAPVPGEPVDFTYLLASCMNVQRQPNQPVWKVIRKDLREPDLNLLVGDNIYLNNWDWNLWNGRVRSDRILARSIEQRAEPHFADLVARVPTYSTWDDHDYGKNNADQRQAGKDNSLMAFRNLWANPSYGTAELEGVFYTFDWGDVQFFVMDNRWYRDATAGGTESQYGPEQLQWLLDQLQDSTATFKIIVSAGDVMEKDLSQDCKDIGVFVAEHNITGVMFNAGDIHRNEYKVRSIRGWPYKVRQISSSGIAMHWRRPFALVRVNTRLADPEITLSFYATDSRNLQDTQWSNDPNLTCSRVEDGVRREESTCTEVIRLSDLTAN